MLFFSSCAYCPNGWANIAVPNTVNSNPKSSGCSTSFSFIYPLTTIPGSPSNKYSILKMTDLQTETTKLEELVEAYVTKTGFAGTPLQPLVAW